MGSSEGRRGRSGVAVASLILTLVVSVQRTDHEDGRGGDGGRVGLVMLLPGVSAAFRNIVRFVILTTMVDQMKSNSDPRGPR